MKLSTNSILIGAPLLLLVLLIIAGYGTTQIVSLSLPIPFAIGFFTIVLPLLTGFSAQPIHGLLRAQGAGLSRSRPTFYLILLFAFQLIYEAVIATLSLTYFVPSPSNTCGLQAQWSSLYSDKNEVAIRGIQDRLDCCGLNTLSHMAWPFQGDGTSATACVEITGRTRSCAGPWRQAEQVNAGLFLTVAGVIFLTKLVAFFTFFVTSPDASAAAWFQSRPPKRLMSNGGRRLLEEAESANQDEEYHDEVEPGTRGNGQITAGNENGNRPRVEPSSQLGGGAVWRDEERHA